MTTNLCEREHEKGLSVLVNADLVPTVCATISKLLCIVAGKKNSEAVFSESISMGHETSLFIHNLVRNCK